MVDHSGVIRRHELTFRECELLAPLLPRTVSGRPRVEDRRVINGMVYKIRTGVSWRNRYGPWKSVSPASDAMPWTACSPGLSSKSRLTRKRPATSTGWCKSAPPLSARTSTLPPRVKRGQHRADEPDDHALGRSREGLTTKIHLACDGRGLPLAILLTPGQRHDRPCARPLLERIRVPRISLGRPRCRPDQVIADKAYSSRGFSAYLSQRGIACTIPDKNDQQRHRHNRGRHGGRPPAFDRQIYRQRNVVERCFNRLKGFRGIATRYDKTATSYEAAINLASLLLWARSV
ncbi:IS5 family transposase [Streptomyces sp. NBC_01198]|uniref:IS5 family transposase n=1 Tax=Streptomyces sp. NBC_01198 TaxID=2903769 RepID=UPI002E137034|nr:IS5 family transposase [Streptomyces sp. NBC_01198]